MKGLNNISFATNLVTEDSDNTLYKTFIPKEDILNKQLECTDFKCTAALNILFAN